MRHKHLEEVTRKEFQEEGAQGGYSQQHNGMARLQMGQHLHCWRECLGKLWWEGGVRLCTGDPWPVAESSVSYFVCGKIYPTEIIHQMEPSEAIEEQQVWLWVKQVHLGQCVLEDRRDGVGTSGESSAASGMGTEIEASSLFSTKKMMGLGDRAGGY